MKMQELRFEQVLREAAHQCMEQEIEDFLAIPTDGNPISRKTDRKILRMIQRSTILSSRPMQMLKITAVVILILGTVGFMTCMSIPIVRASFWEAVTTFFDDHMGIRMEAEESDEYPGTIEEKRIPVVPDGWSAKKVYETWAGVHWELRGVSGEWIQYYQNIYDEDSCPLYIDNAPISKEQIDLNQTDTAYLYTYSDDTRILFWLSDYFFYMVTDSADRETLLSIAESVAAQ